MQTAELIPLLQKASEGLLYMSESDYPYEVICWEGCELTEALLLQKANISPDSPIQRLELSEFVDLDAPDPDWYGEEEKADSAKFRYLMSLIKDNLKDLRVYRVGKIEVQIFILGLLEGQIMGLKTTAIET